MTEVAPRVGHLTLHGRTAERRALATLVEAGGASRSGVLVVRGQPGMGKSALLEDAVRRDGDFRVLRARGAEMESHLPFAGLHQLLKPVLDCLGRLPDHHARALRAAIGIDPSSGTDPFLVAVATLGTLAEAAESSPVVCLVDDAQWLDAASRQALLFVARRLDVEHVVMLFAVRSAGGFDEESSFPAAGLPELRLSGLDEEAAAQLLRDRVGRPVDPTVCRRLVEETEGNPLALLELSADLTPAQLSGRESLPLRLPLTHRLERLFADRIGRLPPRARRALLLAAADDTGRLRTVLLAAPTLGVSTGSLDHAERAGLVQARDGVLTFRHPLVRSAVYQAATAAERQEAHRALAAVMDSHGDADRRAWHLAAAAVEPDEMVVAELDGAAARAHDRGGFEAAGAALERAAELTRAPEERCRRLVSAAQNQWLAGRFTRVAGLLHAARPLASEPSMRADIGQLRAWCELSVGSTTAAERLLLDAAQEVAHIDPPRARRLLAECAAAAWFAPDARGVVELRRIAAGLGPPEDSCAQFFADTLAGYLCQMEGDLAGAFRRLTAAIDLAERMDRPELLTFAGHHAFLVGDNEAAIRISAQVVGRARATGQVIELLFALPRLVRPNSAPVGGQPPLPAPARRCGWPGRPASRSCPRCRLAWLCLLAALRGDEPRLLGPGRRRPSTRRLPRARRATEPVQEILLWARAVQKAQTARPAIRLRAARAADPSGGDHVGGGGRRRGRHRARGSGTRRCGWLGAVRGSSPGTPGRPGRDARVAHCHGLLAAGRGRRGLLPRGARATPRRPQRPFERARTELAYGESPCDGCAEADGRAGAARRPRWTSSRASGRRRGPSGHAEELRACGQTARKRDPSTLLSSRRRSSRWPDSSPRAADQGGRRANVPQPTHGRVPPAQRVHQARDQLPHRARRAGPALTTEPGGFTGMSPARRPSVVLLTHRPGRAA